MPGRLFRKHFSERDLRISPKEESHFLNAVKRVAGPNPGEWLGGAALRGWCWKRPMAVIEGNGAQ